MNMLGPHFLRPYKPQGGCYKRVWEPEFPTSLGVCTCNIYNGLTPASLRGDAAVSYGADACNTPNYVNTLLLTFALIAVYVLPLPELLYILPRWPVRVQSTPRPPHACTWADLLVFDCYGYYTPYTITRVRTLFTYGCIASSLTISRFSRPHPPIHAESTAPASQGMPC